MARSVRSKQKPALGERLEQTAGLGCMATCIACLSPVTHILGVKKIVLVYGILGGVLIAALNLIEYRFLVLEHSLEIYGGLVAAVFSSLGIWLGLKQIGRAHV